MLGKYTNKCTKHFVLLRTYSILTNKILDHEKIKRRSKDLKIFNFYYFEYYIAVSDNEHIKNKSNIGYVTKSGVLSNL